MFKHTHTHTNTQAHVRTGAANMFARTEDAQKRAPLSEILLQRAHTPLPIKKKEKENEKSNLFVK